MGGVLGTEKIILAVLQHMYALLRVCWLRQLPGEAFSAIHPIRLTGVTCFQAQSDAVQKDRRANWCPVPTAVWRFCLCFSSFLASNMQA